MANLNFKYGASYQNLPAAISDGTIYVTKNEKAMYVDLDGARFRLGQIVVYETWADFNATETLPPQSPEAFYYIQDKNALLKYDETHTAWIQINSVSDLQADLSELQATVGSLQTTVTGHTTKISELETEDTAIKGLITEEKNRADAAEKANKKAIEDEASRAIAKENEIAGNLSTLDTTVTNIKNTYVKTETYTAEVSNLQGQITSNDTDITNLQTDLSDTKTSLGQTITKVDDNTSDIADLTTKTTAHTNEINALKAEDTAIKKLISDETTRAKAAEKVNADAISAEVTRATNKETALEGSISANTTAINANKTSIADNKKLIDNLTTYVGAIPADQGDSVIEYIQNQFAAADAMTYKGGISNYDSLPTSGVEAGFTYVVTEDFVYGDDSYYAGDLIIASMDQSGDTYDGGWTHVRTGYIASQENKLVTSGNGVKLQSYTGTNLGSMTVASGKVKNSEGSDVDQITIATTTVGNATTITLSMEWGTF